MARLGKLRWRNRLMCVGGIGCFYSSANRRYLDMSKLEEMDELRGKAEG